MHTLTLRTILSGIAAVSALAALPVAASLAAPRHLTAAAQESSPRKALSRGRIDALGREATADVESRARFTQQMIDQIFSYGELGFQEVETSRYLVDILKENGFEVQEGVAGVPTAWVATWGSGRPVIALGSDIDGIPQASQKPGVACHAPIVPGAPGHGEGHNTGQPVNITAALAVKRIMERERLPGTIKIWPGVAEEQLGSKAYLVRAGVFKDVDIALFSHVGSNLATSWGPGGGSGLVSVLYSFEGSAAHSAGAPWRGRSALDAVELMNVGWNYRREHLRLQQRSHYVIPDGGDQPNVVPTTASVPTFVAAALEPQYGRVMFYGMLLIGVLILFSTQLGIFEAMVRVTTDAAHATSPRLRRMLEGDPRRFYYPFMLLLLVIIAVVLHLALPVSLVQWSANMSNLGALIFPFMLIYLNSKLPRPARPRPWHYVLLLANVLFFGFFFINFIADFLGDPLITF